MASYGGLPDFSTYLSNADQIQAAAAPAPQGSEATGTGNWLTAGLGSGFHGALASAGGLGEALARVAGYDSGADAAASFADSERAKAATYARKDLEEGPWYTPGGLGYRLAQMVPGAAVGLGGAVAGAALAPEEAAAAGLTGIAGFAARHAAALGGSLASYPLVVGENVQRQKDYSGELSQGQAAKALAFGVPEAALQGIVPSKLEGMLAGEVGQGFLKTVRNTALTQLPVGAVTEYLTQQMGDPNRPLADRAQDIITAGLQGAVLGGLQAGALHPLSAALHSIAKTPVQNVTPGGLYDVINQSLNPVEPSHPTPALSDVLPQPAEGFQRTLPGLENLPDQTAPQAPAPQGPEQGAFDFSFNQPTQGELPITGGALQTDMFGRIFPVPGRGYDNGIVPKPEVRAEAPGAPGEQTPIPGLDNLPEQRGPAPDARGIQDRLPLTQDEGPEPEQRTLPLFGGHHQPILEDAGRLGPAGGFDQGAIPAQTMAHTAPQKPLTLEEVKAKTAANRNQPSPDQPPTPQTPVTGLTTQEALRKAGLAPVQVGKEIVNAPTNRNVEGPGATREVSAQGNILEPAKPVAPANDKFDIAPYKSDLKKVPEFRGKEFKTQAEFEQALTKSINDRDADPKKTVPAALVRVAEGLGIMKDGALIERAPEQPLEGPHETLEAGVQEPEVAAKADIPEQHQGRYDRLQAIRDRLGDNLNDPETFGLVKRVTDLQNELQDVKGSNRTGQINSEINELRGKVETRERGPAPQPSDPKALASSTAPTPDAAAFIAARQGQPATAEAKAKARRAGKAVQEAAEPVKSLPENIPAVNPLEAAQDAEAQARMAAEGGPAPHEGDTPIPTQEATRKAAKVQAAPSDNVDRTLEDKFTKRTQEAQAKADKTAKREAKMQAKRDEWDARHETESAAREAAREAADREAAANTPEANGSPKSTREVIDGILGGLKDTLSTDALPHRGQAAKDATLNFGQRMAAKRAQARLDAVDNAEAMKRQKNESQTAQALEAAAAKAKAEKVVTPLTPEIAGILNMLRQSLATLKANPPEGVNATRIKFNKNIAAHEQQLAVIEKAAKEGGLEALQNFRRDHFDDKLWLDALGRLSSAGEAALNTHSTHETYLMEQIAGLRGERPLIRYETQPTVHDVNLANVVNSTGKIGDALEFIRANDPSPMNRMMASILQRLGLDTSVRMASDERLLEDTTRKLGEGELIAGSHNDQLNRISVYDGSNVARTVLHEAFHAATVRALASGSRAASEMRGLFDTLKARAGGGKLYGLTNVEEMVAEAGSNPTFRQFLRSEPVDTGSRLGNMWQGFKNAMFKALGMPERVRTAFDQVMDGAQKLMAENPTNAAIVGDRPLIVERGIRNLVKAVDTVGHEGLSRLARQAEGLATRMSKATTDGILGWVGGRDIARFNQKDAPMQSRYVESGIKTEDRKDTMYKTASVALHAFEGVSKKGEDAINKVVAHVIQGIDATKKWDEHTHLKDSPKADVLKAEHAQAVNDLNVLRRIDGGKAFKAFEAVRAEYDNKFELNNVRQLWDHIRDHQPELAAKMQDPFDLYDRAYAEHDDPQASLKWARDKRVELQGALAPIHSTLIRERDALATQIKADDKLAKAKDASALTKPGRQALDEKYAEAKANYKELNSTLSTIDAGVKRQAQVPYFHIGRDGEHFVTATLAADDNGVAKEEAIKALGDMLQTEGFKDVTVMQGLTNSKFYVRLGSQTERGLMVEALQKLKGHIVDSSIRRGLADNVDIFNQLSSSKMQEMVNQVRANKPDYPQGATDAQKKAIDFAHGKNVSELMRSLVELIPKSSLDRLYQRREGVQGFNANVLQNFRSASHSNSGGLANLTMATENGAARKALRDEMKSIQGNLDMPESRVTSLQQSYNELLARSQHVETYSTTDALDAFRKAGHIMSVGLSPTYVMALGAQMGTLTLPHFGSRHGFVRSAQAMASVTNDTFKITSAVAKGPDRATFGIRKSTLDAAGIKPDDVEFMLDMARRGVINKSYTEAMTGHEGGSSVSQAMHYANAMGRYAEMVPRVQAALVARKIYNEDAAKFAAIKAKNPAAQPTGVLKEFATMNDYAAFSVNETQLDWHKANTPRQATSAGMFGVMSPIINQFMGYQTRLSGLMYRKVHEALGGDATSQKWLLGHAAAVATLAGTLGLPMVAVAASVYDRLADWVTGKDDTDVIASYRNYLASTFGKEVGEVIARGAPRAVGIDFDHAGEGKILPGSTTLMLLTEKRKLEDAERDWLKAEAGHAVGLMFHVAAAARDIANGDYLDASTRMVPEVLKGPLEAYRLAERNFVDKNGQRLPITANATDIMMTAMGIDPAKEAEYNEEQRTETGLNAMRQVRSQNITRHLLLAQSRGDGAMFQDWERQATQFQLDHPGMAGPLQDFGRSLATHAKSVAIARGFGTPLGVKPRDVVGRGMTSFGNLRDQ